MVFKLKKSLYGLKQSTRIWYQNFDTYLLRLGFERRKVDHYVCCKQAQKCFFNVVLYVYDMFVGCKQHGGYQGGEIIAIHQVWHDISWWYQFHLGAIYQKKSCKEETLVKQKKMCWDNITYI